MNNFINYEANDGYVNVKNMGGFTAFFTLEYMFKGEKISLSSGVITLFFSSKLVIPANATDIYITVCIYNGLSQWVPIYNNNLSESGIVDLQLYGTVWSPQYYVISDSNPTKFLVSVENEGGFIIRYSVEYIFDNIKYRLSSGNFSLGMTRVIQLPDLAENINVLVEMDISGLDVWKPVYNNSFSNVLDLSLRVSGVTVAPIVEVLKNSSLPTIVGGSGEVPTISNSNEIDVIKSILEKYMDFKKQIHNNFIDLINKK